MNDTPITLVGNLTADPELRWTPAGMAITTFTVASTPRVYDRKDDQWKDGEALFLRCTVWRDAAEHVAETLSRGSRVIVTGRLKQRSFETRDGDKRTVIEVDVDEVGPSLRYLSATLNKAARANGNGRASNGAAANGAGSDDSWASVEPPAFEDEPAPF